METLINIFKDFNLNYILLIAILLIAGIYLKRFIPALAEQYQALIVFCLGLLFGWYLINNALLGFAFSGLVFYKDIFVEEVKILKDCINDIIEKDEE